MIKKRTLQSISEEVYRIITSIHRKSKEDEVLVMNGIHNISKPILFSPIALYGENKGCGLIVGRYTTNFVLFDNPEPWKDQDRCSVILNIQGGSMEGFMVSDRKYVNTILTIHHRKDICAITNHALAMSLVYGEFGKLVASGSYETALDVSNEMIEKFLLLSKEGFPEEKVIDHYPTSIAY